MDHIYGSDESLSSDEFLGVYKIYIGRGGSWEALMRGDLDQVGTLEKVLETFVNYRRALRGSSDAHE